MHYAIPSSSEEILALRQRPVDEELLAVAIAGVVRWAKSQGKSLEDLTTEILSEDPVLDEVQRDWLCQLITQTWSTLP